MNRYLKITLTNPEPLTISDIYNSKSDEAVALPAINGAAIRGALMNRLAADGNLEAVKYAFFDNSISFLSAYPVLCNESNGAKTRLETIPAPKGFYEKKQADGKILHTFCKRTNNTQNQSNDENPFAGTKRAKNGKFAVVDGDTLLYASPDMGETFKIRLARNQMQPDKQGKKTQKLFRGDYLEKNQIFTAYIAFKDTCPAEIRNLVESEIRKPGLRLGGSRSSGYGTVKVTELCWLEKGKLPFEKLSSGGRQQEENGDMWYIDMLCLSPLCMLNEYGEPCGLDVSQLAGMLGLAEEQVTVINSSTSITHICGFNRMAGGRSAEYPVFEAGSIFRIACAEKPSAEKLRAIEDAGLGILTEEGLGRVLFVTNLEKVTKKKECRTASVEETVSQVLAGAWQYQSDMEQMKRQTASAILKTRLESAGYDYILNNPFPRGSASKSQRSNVLILCKSLRYTPQKAVQEFENYFAHIEEKEKRSRVHTTRHGSQLTMRDGVMRILQSDITELLLTDERKQKQICDVPIRKLLDSEQEMKYKLNLIEEMIRYANRKESADEES